MTSELKHLNWNTMSENEQNAWITVYAENKEVVKSGDTYMSKDSTTLPDLDLTRLYEIESALGKDTRGLYVENILNEMSAKFGEGQRTHAKFYFLLLNTPIDVRTLCLYHTLRGDYV